MITELKRTYLMDLLGAEKLSTWSADGREQGDNLPRVVMVVMERVNHNIQT